MNLDQIPKVIKDKDYYAKFIQEYWKKYKENKLENFQINRINQIGQNNIVSVRSYLDRVIGESLNQALYDLEVQRERSPDKKELFTANGSIKFISQYLLDHKQ